MKKIKFLALAVVAMLASAAFVSCSKDDNNTPAPTPEPTPVVPESNWTKYQKAVNETIEAVQKKSGNKKAILLVAFGSTWQKAFNSFDATKKAYEQQFPGYDVFVSFSSAICINRAAAGEHANDPGEYKAEIRNYYSPNFWLEGFGQLECYKDITVQSLQVIPGEEFTRVVNYMKDFANNSLGDIDDDFLSQVTLRLGTPLLDTQDDVKEVAAGLNDVMKDKVKEGVVAFMGHGNPDTYDTYKANTRYTQLEEALQAINPNYYVGTVDMPENYKTFVYERMVNDKKTSGTVYLHPLMSVAGDHTHNDMAGDDGEDMEPKDWEVNDEGEIEDLSWKVYFGKLGYDCNDDTMVLNGLLDVPAILKVWMNHTKTAIESDPLDGFYHSKNPDVE